MRTGASVRDNKERFDVESERHHVDHMDRLWALPQPGSERDMSLIFHTVNKMILPCRVNSQPPMVISPKYTRTCTVTHS